MVRYAHVGPAFVGVVVGRERLDEVGIGRVRAPLTVERKGRILRHRP
jgi:hypothetical protein